MKKIILISIILFLLTVLPVFLQAGINLPNPEKITLKNGLVVYYLKNDELPLVSFNLLFKSVSPVYDPKGMEGISSFTSRLVLKGNKLMNADTIAEELDFIGADLYISSENEYALMHGNCLKEYAPKLFKIAADSLLAPLFDDKEFNKEQAQRLERVKAIKDNAQAAIRYYFKKAYFDDHPMGNPDIGTEESLQKISLKDLKEFYKLRFRPDLATLAVVGDIDKKSLMKLLNDTFEKWPRPAENPPSLDIPPFPEIKGKKLILIDRPDLIQTYFILGSPGIPVDSKIAPDAHVINTLFGGRFTSWLNTELRIKRGLTYGARSYMEKTGKGGVFYFFSYTKNDKIGEMLDITMELLNKARTTGFLKEEIESGRNYILGQFPPQFETNERKASTYLELDFYNLGFDFYSKYLEKVGQAQQEEANKIAAGLFPGKDYVLVILGKADEIKEILKKYGTFKEKKIGDPGF